MWYLERLQNWQQEKGKYSSELETALTQAAAAQPLLMLLPVLSSMTWFEDHLQWDRKVILPELAPHATFTLPVNWGEWILASFSWTMNNSREDNSAMRVKLDLRELIKPQRCVLAMVSILGSGYSKLSLTIWQFFNFSILEDCLLSWERILEIQGRQLLREGGCLVLVSGGFFSYRAASFSHLLSSSLFLLSY